MEAADSPRTYLIGGLPRTGKSTLSTQLAIDLGAELIRTDTLRAMFNGEAGSRLAYASGLKIKKVITAFEPYLRVLVSGHTSRDAVIVEGEMIGAKAAARLQQEAGVKSCFLGLNDPDAACARIERSTDPQDWMATLDSAERRRLLDIYARRSDRLSAVCGRLGLQYYDASDHLDQVQEHAYRYLADTAVQAVSPAE